MPAHPHRGLSLLPLLAVVATLIICLGLFSMARIVFGPPAPVATPLPTRPAPTAPPAATPAPAATEPPSLAAAAQQPAAVSASVVNVIDGDTIEVSLDGAAYTVRYIGIDTPERGQTCYGEAAAFNAGLVEGKTVTLLKDVSETDQHHRLLRYVYVDGLFVNAELVRLGYARAVSFPPDTAHYQDFVALEDAAREAGLGCHAMGVFTEAGGVGGSLQGAATPGGGERGNCDPAYPTVCIPPPPPDLDCGEINFRRFQVLPPDPHHFDGDNDGVGCQN